MNNKVTSKSISSELIDSKTLSGSNFDLSIQSELFDTLKQLRFNGQLVLTEPQGERWIIYLHLGHAVFATGGTHPVKRWNRTLITYLPEIFAELSREQSQLSNNSLEENRGWQYQLLCSWVKQDKITRQQATKIIWSILVEVLFDITQVGQIKGNIAYELKPCKSSSQGIVLINGSRIVAEVKRQWLSWQQAQAADYRTNLAPVIKQREQLQQNTSATVFEMLSRLLNGQQTLRDLALDMKRDTLSVTRSILPYLQSGLVELINIPDLPEPVLSAPSSIPLQTPLIACVDDSPLICNSLEKFMTAAGYRFVGINDPMRAFSVLLALKPDLIFLDLMMPNINGYELCDKLRRISVFRNTPIIILTGNDGVIDRVKTKLVGASDFLSKANVDKQAVSETLQKHLRHCTLSKLTTTNTTNTTNNPSDYSSSYRTKIA
ncbi:MAG: response regulator [Pleurocapsa sp. MO_192.B19]|nr:response regulator [Pleurocapsa sp. MO_192.B19]